MRTACDAAGKWSAQGKLAWPWGAEYDQPQPIRVCYPNVALRNRALYFCGVSDIVEPYQSWRQYKKQLTGREWDYDASSSEKTLGIMLVVALIGMPLVLTYTTIVYWTFRRVEVGEHSY